MNMDTEPYNKESAEEAQAAQPPKKSVTKRIFSILFALFIVVCLAIISFNVYLRVACVCVVVSGDSMKNTLKDGDVLFVRKSAAAKRGDIVVIDVTGYENDATLSGDYIIKRVIATEGDSLYCENDVVYIRYAGAEEYVPLTEEYVYSASGNTSFREVTVGENQVFVMGDNRKVSYDSRYIGCVNEDILVGPVAAWSLACKDFVTAYYDFFNLKPQGGESAEFLGFLGHGYVLFD